MHAAADIQSVWALGGRFKLLTDVGTGQCCPTRASWARAWHRLQASTELTRLDDTGPE